MRLTLRTLLAWLDDTLPTAEVRQIGQQVNESPVARELVERIHRVTRQRRLTVPEPSGPDGMDPNKVAEYLDNLLPPDGVSDFEKVCLRSDVHLAEVASVHQILSLLGQRAKVPPEARHRMYRLNRGREATRSAASRVTLPEHPEPAAALPPWSQPVPPKASWIERFGPALGVLALVVLLSWSTYRSLAPEEPPAALPTDSPAAGSAKAPPLIVDQNRGQAVEPIAKDDEPAKSPILVTKDAPQSGQPAEDAPNDHDLLADATAGAPAMAGTDLAGASEPAKVGSTEESKVAEPDESEALPANVLGKLAGGDGILLRRDGEEQPWERVTESSSLRAGNLLVSLDPFRVPITLGKGRIVLVKGAIVRIDPPAQGAVADLELREGQVILQGTTPPERYEVALGGTVVGIRPPVGGAVGVERVNRLSPGEPQAAEPWLRISAANGPTELTSPAGSETLKAGESVQFTAKGGFQEKAADPAPAWLTETDPPVIEQEAGRQFARFFGDQVPPLTGLVEATVDDRPEMRKLAVEALGLVGQIPLVVGAFNAPGDDQAVLVRHAAIAAMRSILARGGKSARALHDELVLAGGSEEWANLVAKLLAGYPADEPDAPKSLVKLLESPDVGVRELALQNLMLLSQRADALGYDPDAPTEGDGLKRWKELLDRGEILPKTATP